MKNGIATIVGAGPGDKDLITVKGLERLRQAEVVLYDRLVNPDLLDEAPPGAERIYVGKEPGQHACPQEKINALLCEAVAAGKRVVRLKGGDPFIFGRGGEEVQALQQAGLRHEVIPGVTSAMAAASAVGIPLTLREHSTGLTLVTGHETTDKNQPPVDWRALGALDHTLCIYMGLHRIEWICAELIAGGRPESEPVAVIQWATLPAQRHVTGTLANIAEVVRREQIGPPGLIIVGEVARPSQSDASNEG